MAKKNDKKAVKKAVKKIKKKAVPKERQGAGKKQDPSTGASVTWTMKMEIFCQEYVVDFNGSRAARAAGYSEASCHEIASENLRKPRIKKRIEEIISTHAAASAITKERILQELADIAFADTRDVVKFVDGKIVIKDSDKLTAAQAAAISQITQKSGNTTEKSVKFHDKTKALEMLARHKGMMKEDDAGRFTGVIVLDRDQQKF